MPKASRCSCQLSGKPYMSLVSAKVSGALPVENPVKGEQKKKVLLKTDQIERAAEIYHKWLSEGTDGVTYAVPELYKSVHFDEIKKNNFSLVPSRYIEFVDRDQSIDYEKVMSEAAEKVSEILARQEANRTALENAFAALGYKTGDGK